MVRNVVIVNGNSAGADNELNPYLLELKSNLFESGISCRYHSLKEKNISQCIGCWDCWWKTPGICRFIDDEAEILKDMIHSDLVVFASPLIMGMYSSLLKKFHDRAIPIVHPYIDIVQGECHHLKRYDEYPKIGVIYEKNDASEEEIDNTKFIFDRIAINLHSEVKFFYSVNEKNPNEINDEINRF